MLDDDALPVSIYVMAYNRLEKTKTCVACVLKHTVDVAHELILVDNGCTDDTLQFFESVTHPRKTVIRITKNIGAAYALQLIMAQARGRYIVSLSNDLYVTKNWLSNMLACAESDSRIGMVNPVSSNVSNFQNIEFAFASLEEMQSKAAEHNISDPRKWQERLRLVTLGTLYKRECLDMIGKADYGFFHDFVDDDLTFRVRRAGYKAVLCGDVFVHHDHDLMKDRDPDEFRESLEKGRLNFKEKYFGVDAWDDASNYEPVMMSLVNPEEKRGAIAPQILGIDVRCGTPILEVKNRLRRADVFDARLAGFTSEAKYYLDLQTICDGRVYADRLDHLGEYFNPGEFDYIVLGKPINTYDQPYSLLREILALLKNDGQFLVKLKNTHDVQTFFTAMSQRAGGDGQTTSHISLDELNGRLARAGYCLKGASAELHSMDETSKGLLRKAIGATGLARNVDESFTRLLVKDYVLSIARSGR
jgi:GT2 family glycosyltransferase